MLIGLQRFGPDVREGRRRQYNYIGMFISLPAWYLYNHHFILYSIAALFKCMADFRESIEL
jgi:hypothetical protein